MNLISARRLAREWALKTLYQQDLNRSEMKEALNSSFERLRREFVNRGSKGGSGSLLEEEILDAITLKAMPLLPHLSTETQAAVKEIVEHFFSSGEVWSSVVMATNTKRNTYKSLLETPQMLTPNSPAYIFPDLDTELLNSVQLPVDACVGVGKIGDWMQGELSYLTLKVVSKELNAARPKDINLKDAVANINEGWQSCGKNLSERWEQVGQVVKKQTSDWMRVASFTWELVEGVTKNQVALDMELTKLVQGWSLERQASVDRNIMRLAAFEMLYSTKTPPSVAINEAIELSKKYSSLESGKFVNGILGALSQSVRREVVVIEPAQLAETPIVETLLIELSLEDSTSETVENAAL